MTFIVRVYIHFEPEFTHKIRILFRLLRFLFERGIREISLGDR